MEIRRTGIAEYGKWIKALIAGEPGSGKTRTASTWPNVFYAAIDPGMMSVADRAVAYTDVRSTNDLAEVRRSLDQTPSVREKIFGFPVETVVVDTIDELQKLLIRERLAETRKDALVLQDWGWLGEQMQAILRGFRNLDLHVLFLVHTKVDKDDEAGRMFIRPGLQGAIATEVPGFVDLSLLLKARPRTVIEGDKTVRVVERVLQTQPDASAGWIKDRSGKLPHEVLINFEDDFERLHSTVFSGLNTLPESLVLKDTPVVPATPAPVAPQDIAPRGSTKTVQTPDVERRVAAVKARKDHPAPPNVDAETGEILEEKGGGPVTAPVESPVAPVDTPTDEAVCESCGAKIESVSQTNISKIRFRKLLCKNCYQAHGKKAS